MTNREKLLRCLSQVQFALWELHLYLNTHPTDMEAIALHEQYEIKLLKLRDEFEEKYGPLTANVGEGVDWLKNPWPWDIEGD
ncbi:MAG: spore coat protein CotJB [Oscillospiraceae bacterium]|nr:spore coat protein CotJB [Oscillospiraceae bacterium]